VAHPGLDHRAGAPARRRDAKKNGGAQAEALGRSRGGFGTKLHAAVNSNLVERFWNEVQHDRRGATRDEKIARNCLAFIHVASIMVLLQ
jgi:hypothetical protein